jgi:hypothetical protein
MDMHLILNGYQYQAARISRNNCIRFLFVGFDEDVRLQKRDWINETNCSLAFWMQLPLYGKVKINLDERVAKCIEVNVAIFADLL